MCSMPNADIAKQIGLNLVEARVTGCVQIIPSMHSIYIWNEKVCQETECLLVIKSLTAKWPCLERMILQLHPYDEPELIAVPASKVTPGYLRWLQQQLLAIPKNTPDD